MRVRLERLRQAVPSLGPDDHFFLMPGQPDHVKAEWADAMGLAPYGGRRPDGTAPAGQDGSSIRS